MADHELFQPGDIVQLKSGSPKMTVWKSDKGITHCFCYDEKNKEWLMDTQFPTCVLKAVKKDKE